MLKVMRLKPTATHKYCAKCGELRPKTEFAVRKKTHDGLHTICRKHHNEMCTAWYHRSEANRKAHIARVARTRNDWCKRDPGMKRAWYVWNSMKAKGIVPKWVKFRETVSFYQEAVAKGKGWRVAHILPPNGPTACGLHVPSNLEVRQAKKYAPPPPPPAPGARLELEKGLKRAMRKLNAKR